MREGRGGEYKREVRTLCMGEGKRERKVKETEVMCEREEVKVRCKLLESRYYSFISVTELPAPSPLLSSLSNLSSIFNKSLLSISSTEPITVQALAPLSLSLT